jgi:hypothetical protein
MGTETNKYRDLVTAGTINWHCPHSGGHLLNGIRKVTHIKKLHAEYPRVKSLSTMLISPIHHIKMKRLEISTYKYH